MEERKNVIRNYILKKIDKLKAHGIYIDKDKIETAVNKYSYIQGNMRDIMKQIDKDAEELLENYKTIQQLREEYIKKLEVNKDLKDIPLEYSGIKLDTETEELMKIGNIKDSEKLKESLVDSTKIDPTMEDLNLTDKQVLNAKKEIFDLYQDTEIDKHDYLKDSSSLVNKKLDYLEDTGKVTENEKNILSEIVVTSTSTDEMVDQIENNFEEEKQKDMYEIINEETPIENTNMENTITKDPTEIEETSSIESNQEELNDMFDDEQSSEEKEELQEEKPKQFVKVEDNIESNEESSEE